MRKSFGSLNDTHEVLRNPAVRRWLVFWLGFFGVGLTVVLLLGMRAWTLSAIGIQILSGVASLLVLLGAEAIIRRIQAPRDTDPRARA